MASSKKPKPDEKKKKSNSSAVKQIKKAIQKPEKKTSSTKTPTKSKPKPKAKQKPKPKQKSKAENNKSKKKKSSNGTVSLVESEDVADPSSSSESEEHENGKKRASKNVKPDKRKQKEKVEENGEDKGGEAEATMCRFPMSRIKRIMKSEDSRIALSQDVVFLVNKATEKFLEKFCEDGYKASVKDRKKALSYKHLSNVVRERRRYEFLSDYVPEKVKAEDALKERNITETGTG